MTVSETKWPKTIPELSAEQAKIRQDFMKLWHEILPAKYGVMEDINHRYALLEKPGNGVKTLEIGAGLGAHLEYENLSIQDYTANELRPQFAERIRERFPGVKTVVGDIQQGLDLPEASFDRIVAIHVLEHLPNLPKALLEIKRLLKPNGYFSIVIPCEGGLAYTLARRISAQRIFEKTYKMKYDWFIKSEHVSTAQEILEEVEKVFQVEKSRFFPLLIPATNLNLVIGLTCRNK